MKSNTKRDFRNDSKALIMKAGIPLLLFLFSFRQADSETPELPTIRKEMKITGDFQNIRLDGNSSIVLTNDPPGTVILEGTERDVNKVWHSVKENTLLINTRRNWLACSKITIYLSAITVQDLQVNGDGDISSVGFVKANDLHISMNGNIDVKVKTIGRISVDAPEGFELQWKTPVLKR